ncbi:unnamed protein product [Chrysoparadoxa australica]
MGDELGAAHSWDIFLDLFTELLPIDDLLALFSDAAGDLEESICHAAAALDLIWAQEVEEPLEAPKPSLSWSGVVQSAPNSASSPPPSSFSCRAHSASPPGFHVGHGRVEVSRLEGSGRRLGQGSKQGEQLLHGKELRKLAQQEWSEMCNCFKEAARTHRNSHGALHHVQKGKAHRSQMQSLNCQAAAQIAMATNKAGSLLVSCSADHKLVVSSPPTCGEKGIRILDLHGLYADEAMAIAAQVITKCPRGSKLQLIPGAGNNSGARGARLLPRINAMLNAGGHDYQQVSQDLHSRQLDLVSLG